MEVLLYDTVNYIHYPLITQHGKENEKNVYTHVCMWVSESFGCKGEINTTL